MEFNNSILYVKDSQGNFKEIPSIKGSDGKDAQSKVTNITLGTTWTKEGNNYIQNVTLQGLSQLDYPIVNLVPDINNVETNSNEYAKLISVIANDNSLKFYAKEPTTKDLTLNVMHHDVVKQQANIFDQIYPIGSIYMNINNVEPSLLFGGTWQKIAQGRCLIGANVDYPLGSTGGEKEHKLAIAEMPRHFHNVAIDKDYNGFPKAPVSSGTYNSVGLLTKSGKDFYCYPNTEAYANGFNGNTGGNQPHNNMQPYLAVNIWERIG